MIAILPREPGWRLVLFGKHEEKMKLITAQNIEKIVATGAYSGKFESLFDVVIEASGDPSEYMAVKIPSLQIYSVKRNFLKYPVF